MSNDLHEPGKEQVVASEQQAVGQRRYRREAGPTAEGPPADEAPLLSQGVKR